jgi:hypothetical protein
MVGITHWPNAPYLACLVLFCGPVVDDGGLDQDSFPELSQAAMEARPAMYRYFPCMTHCDREIGSHLRLLGRMD